MVKLMVFLFDVLKINVSNMVRQEILYQENCIFSLAEYTPVGYVLEDEDEDLKVFITLGDGRTIKITNVYGVISISDFNNFYNYKKNGKYLDVTFLILQDGKYNLSNIVKSIQCNDIVIFSTIYIA